MKCARCKKDKPTTPALWKRGPNGNRVYQLCAECKAKVEKENGQSTVQTVEVL